MDVKRTLDMVEKTETIFGWVLGSSCYWPTPLKNVVIPNGVISAHFSRKFNIVQDGSGEVASLLISL